MASDSFISADRSQGEGLATMAPIFVRFVVVVIASTAALKVWTVFFVTSAYLSRPDAFIYFLNGRQLLGVAAVMELVVLVQLLDAKVPMPRKLFAVAALSSAFGAYRILQHFAAANSPCNCFGSLSYLIGAGLSDKLAKVILAFMLTCSYALLFAITRSTAK